MGLQSLQYCAFLVVVAAVYLHLPVRMQPVFLLGASWVFYALAMPAMLPVTIALAVFTYLCGRGLAWLGGAHKTAFLRLGVIGMLGILAFFKYNGLLGGVLHGWRAVAMPLGISFTSFAAIAYLIDATRGDCEVETSFIRLALFLNFFATVTQGPICRAGALLPQLSAEHRFDAARTVRALRLYALGLFKYIAVADVLNMVVDTVFPHYADYSAPMLILTAVMYTFYLYFSFSGYSEISRATGLVLGLDLPENFKTPFYATNFSGFWNRWHISFSSWLQDYLFMPLAWADISPLTRGRRERLPVWVCLFCVFFVSGFWHGWHISFSSWLQDYLFMPLAWADLGRFGRLPTELCVFCVFFASGFWHGSTAPFIIWGLLQAVYRVGEELLHRRFGKPKKRGTPARVLWGKRVVVFVLWTISMVFFRVGSGNLSGMAENLGVGDAFVYLGRCLMNSWSPARFAGELYSTAYTGFYANTIMVAAYWAFAALALALGIWLDHRRNFACKNKPAEVALASAKHRNALYVVLIVFILVGYIMQSGGFNANAFGPYAGF